MHPHQTCQPEVDCIPMRELHFQVIKVKEEQQKNNNTQTTKNKKPKTYAVSGTGGSSTAVAAAAAAPGRRLPPRRSASYQGWRRSGAVGASKRGRAAAVEEESRY